MRQLVARGHGGGGGVLADRGGGGAAAAAGEGGVAGVADGGGVDRLPPAGPAADPSGHPVLRPAPVLRRLPLPPPLRARGLRAIAGGGLHAAALRDPC